jgi:hypothetical protein
VSSPVHNNNTSKTVKIVLAVLSALTFSGSVFAIYVNLRLDPIEQSIATASTERAKMNTNQQEILSELRKIQSKLDRLEAREEERSRRWRKDDG